MESALKINNQYESIEFISPIILTLGKTNIVLLTRLKDNKYSDYLNIPHINKVTKVDLLTLCKLVSKHPFNYDVMFIIPKYHNKNKIEDFLYDITYSNLDYNYAKNNMIYPESGGCSSIRLGNYFGRNFDWVYNNDVQFVVHTPSSLNYYGTLGVAGIIPGINKDTVDLLDIEYENKDMYKLLPFYLLDGINEKGLFVAYNLVPDFEDTEIVAKVEEREIIHSTMLVRFILDRFGSVNEAINYLINYTTIIIDKGCHFIIGDNSKTYIIEFINGEIKLICKNYITNFNIYNVKFNKDNTIIYPNPTLSGIDLFGFGLERWDIIATNKDDIRTLLKKLLFTNMYKDTFWYSEVVKCNDDDGNIITIDTLPEKCLNIKETALLLFAQRDRDEANTWLTCHSSIYDIRNRVLYIRNLENDVEYELRD